ncbi:MAG TPA: sialidase family protein [Rugosimonospora sp.]
MQPRITSVSRDRGETWSHPVYDSAVALYTAVDSSLARYSDAGPGSDVSRVLFSLPDNAATRSNLVVSVSYDDGLSYPYSGTVYSGPASYSDIARLADGTIRVLYGKDLTASSLVDHVAVARFNLAWLTGGRDCPNRGPEVAQYVTQAESAHPGTGTGHGRPDVLADTSASGYRYVDYQATGAGDYLALDLIVTRVGTYDVFARCRRSATGATIQASVDGTPSGAAFSTAFAGAVGYAEFACGRHTFARPGRHTIWFASTGTAGTSIDIDYVRLQTPVS